MLNCVIVGIGGFIGTVCRYLIGLLPFEMEDVYKRQAIDRRLSLSPPACFPAAPLLLDKYARRIMAARHRADGYILSVPSRAAGAPRGFPSLG